MLSELSELFSAYAVMLSDITCPTYGTGQPSILDLSLACGAGVDCTLQVNRYLPACVGKQSQTQCLHNLPAHLLFPFSPCANTFQTGPWSHLISYKLPFVALNGMMSGQSAAGPFYPHRAQCFPHISVDLQLKSMISDSAYSAITSIQSYVADIRSS